MKRSAASSRKLSQIKKQIEDAGKDAEGRTLIDVDRLKEKKEEQYIP